MRKGIWGFALVAIMLLMASCSSKSEYANAIPKDAAMSCHSISKQWQRRVA
mgnify:CR=1 FL=1